MTEKGIKTVMDALSGTPTLTTSEFAEEVEITLRESMIHQIEHRARTEKRIKDRDYNEGAKLIREYGYEAVKDRLDVVYWCRCNGFD